ncbi:DUF3761 domain-containing protein [[Flexibacter] sp. ATCC 35208]|uniref:DUF3761 domain-containing protein n=1 Tax=[Flexibacter] sp. ATCC 35208 TaxID=1936242 RepID=UPI0009CB0EB3|nr:DUF3761 domain-containing protein [[Flexibacter] sp. ATCC 35208]OMP80873.1 hypothetical protein BW716_02355 [[Flexibacter] sp. ATCC 35208]
MKYIPNLIPENAKVIPEYFVSGHTTDQTSFAKKFLTTAGVVFLYMLALGSIPHPPLAILFFIMSTGLLLPVHRWLERKLHFTFTSIIKAAVYSLLLIPSFILIVNSADDIKAGGKPAVVEASEKQPAEKQADPQKDPAQAQAQHLLMVQDSIRKDSLSKDLVLLNNPEKIANISFDEIDKRYDHAIALATSPEEKAQVDRAVEQARTASVSRLMKSKKYNDALNILTVLMIDHPNDVSMLYQRALCYDKLGDDEEAVKDLRKAMELGSAEANTLHEKINPEIKKVTGYVTRCCDGSISYSTGRGTCSHHGGVCGREPEYETSRKYE